MDSSRNPNHLFKKIPSTNKQSKINWCVSIAFSPLIPCDCVHLFREDEERESNYRRMLEIQKIEEQEESDEVKIEPTSDFLQSLYLQGLHL